MIVYEINKFIKRYIFQDYSLLTDYECVVGAVKYGEKLFKLNLKDVKEFMELLNANEYIQECQYVKGVINEELIIQCGKWYGIVRKENGNVFKIVASS